MKAHRHRSLTLLLVPPLLLAGAESTSYEVDSGTVATAPAGQCDRPDVETCIGIELWIVRQDGAPVQSMEWVTSQLALSNHHFSAIGVAFEVIATHTLPQRYAIIESRRDRDRLGRDRWTSGGVHVFLVGRLDNVDEPGTINGVHWRDREDTSHRWIILSATAADLTLVHELGHFFTLSHSDTFESLMNKTPRSISRDALRFHEDELDQMRRVIAERRTAGTLLNRLAQ